MTVIEDPTFSRDYLDPEKRSIANALQIRFKDGTQTEKVTVEFPIGHPRRRQEGIPKLIQKFEENMKTRYPAKQLEKIMNLVLDQYKLEATPVSEFMNLLTI